MVYVGGTGFFSLLLLINKRRKHLLGFPMSVSQTVKTFDSFFFFCKILTVIYLPSFSLLLSVSDRNVVFVFIYTAPEVRG